MRNEQAVGKKEQFWPIFGCCTADSQTDTGRHQLYNNGSHVLFSTAWKWSQIKQKLSIFSNLVNGVPEGGERRDGGGRGDGHRGGRRRRPLRRLRPRPARNSASKALETAAEVLRRDERCLRAGASCSLQLKIPVTISLISSVQCGPVTRSAVLSKGN